MFLQSSRFSRRRGSLQTPAFTGKPRGFPDPNRTQPGTSEPRNSTKRALNKAAKMLRSVQCRCLQAVQSLVVRGRRAADSRPARICGPFAPALCVAFAVPGLGRDCAVESEEVLGGAWVGVGRVRLPQIRVAIAPLGPPSGQRNCSGRDGCPLLWLPSLRVDRTPPQSASPARRCRRRSSGRGRR
jgi:hypothetical protein